MERPHSISVALVDDDESLCRSLGRLLRAVGIRSTSFSSAEEFLSEDDRSRFDCLVLDVQLPGINGLELQAQLAADGDRTPVIFITAQDETGLQEETLEAGCAGYFRKTDPGDTILAAIREAVDARRDPPPNQVSFEPKPKSNLNPKTP